MPKINKSDRQLAPEPGERAYFFPKAEGGPKTVLASSRKEAEQKITSKKNKK